MVLFSQEEKTEEASKWSLYILPQTLQIKSAEDTDITDKASNSEWHGCMCGLFEIQEKEGIGKCCHYH